MSLEHVGLSNTPCYNFITLIAKQRIDVLTVILTDVSIGNINYKRP
jgi:hypothetical protein